MRTGGVVEWCLRRCLAWLVALFAHSGPLPALAQEVVWTVGAPVLRLGNRPEPEFQFHQVTGLLLHNDRVYVADRGSGQMRRFDLATGDFISAAGRLGEGPGEFQWLTWIDTCSGEEVVAFDPILGRTSVFSLDLEHLRTFDVRDRSGVQPQLVRCAGPAALVAGYRLRDLDREPGPYRTQLDVIVHSLDDGSPQGVAARYPGADRYREPAQDGPLRFGREPVIASLPNGFVLGTADQWLLTRHDASGQVADTLTADFAPVPITGADLDAYLALRLERARADGRDQAWLTAARRAFAEYEHPSHYPPYSDALSTRSGTVWVRRYPEPAAPANPAHWKVFSPAGNLEAVVEFPPDYELMWVADALTAGVTVDALGVESVEVRPIRRGVDQGP